jgi:hypothetical protein
MTEPTIASHALPGRFRRVFHGMLAELAAHVAIFAYRLAGRADRIEETASRAVLGLAEPRGPQIHSEGLTAARR